MELATLASFDADGLGSAGPVNDWMAGPLCDLDFEAGSAEVIDNCRIKLPVKFHTCKSIIDPADGPRQGFEAFHLDRDHLSGTGGIIMKKKLAAIFGYVEHLAANSSLQAVSDQGIPVHFSPLMPAFKENSLSGVFGSARSNHRLISSMPMAVGSMRTSDKQFVNFANLEGAAPMNVQVP